MRFAAWLASGIAVAAAGAAHAEVDARVSYGGQWGELDAANGATSAFDAHTTSLEAGVSGEAWRYGLRLDLTTSTFDPAGASPAAETDGYSVAGKLGWSGAHWSFDGSFGAGQSDVSSSRLVSLGGGVTRVLTADSTTDSVFGSASFGRTFAAGAAFWRPYGGLDIASGETDVLVEFGQGGATLSQATSFDSQIARAGVNLSVGERVNVWADAALAYEFSSSSGGLVNASFASGAQRSYPFAEADASGGWGELAGGISVPLGERVSLDFSGRTSVGAPGGDIAGADVALAARF